MKCNEYCKMAFIVFIALLLTLPLLQSLFGFVPTAKLSGVTMNNTKPKFSWEQWLSGDFQKQFEKWYSQNFGLREIYIKLNNQIFYSLFHEQPPGKLPVLLVMEGKNNELYGYSHILGIKKRIPFRQQAGFYEMFPPASQEKLETKAVEIKQLQDSLTSLGIHFMVVLTPTKASIYPENIPDFISDNSRYPLTNYQQFVPLLQRYNIQYSDTVEVLKEAKQANYSPLFPQGGLHWNRLGAYFAAKKMADDLSTIAGRDLPAIQMTGIYFDDNPTTGDKDLLQVMNLLAPPDKFLTPHPSIAVDEANRNYHPSILIVGGSFSNGLAEILADYKIASQLDVYQYLVTKIQYLPEKKVTDMDKTNLDWAAVFQSDIIILEANEEYIHEAGSGFVRQALDHIEQGKLIRKNIK